MSTFWFALMNVMVKMLVHLPTMELVFFRCTIATLIGFTALYQKKISWKGSNRKLLILRGVFGTSGLFTFFYTLQHIPLGTAVTIQYLSPIFTGIIAVWLLKEKILPQQWVYFLISFSGIMVIKGFDTKVSWQLLSIGILSAVFSALAYNMVRTLREKEHPLVVVLHFQLLGAIVGGIFTVFDWKLPHGTDWVYLLLLGIFTQLGQINLTRSLQAESINRVSILNYIGIFYALLFGWLLFGEIHGWPVLVGILLVITGVFLNLQLTSRFGKTKIG